MIFFKNFLMTFLLRAVAMGRHDWKWSESSKSPKTHQARFALIRVITLGFLMWIYRGWESGFRVFRHQIWYPKDYGSEEGFVVFFGGGRDFDFFFRLWCAVRWERGERGCLRARKLEYDKMHSFIWHLTRKGKWTFVLG